MLLERCVGVALMKFDEYKMKNNVD